VSGISRRSLLTAAALTAAGAPALSLLRGTPAFAGENPYVDAFQSMVAGDKNIRSYTVQGGEILYRPRQVLVALADVERVLAALRKAGYVVTLGEAFAGVRVLLFDREVDVPGIVLKLRDPRQWQGQKPPVLQPHHVLVGHPWVMGNPADAPDPDKPLPDPDPAHLGDGAGVVVGICDTGIWHDAAAFHPLWLGGAYPTGTTQLDPLYLHDDWLALEAGHGTFVAGVLRQAAPGVHFVPQATLNSSGIGDEQSLVQTLTAAIASGPLVNLSLGYYTLGDVAPTPIANTLATLPTGSLVVASAGNSSSSRLQWPAAFSTVLSVAAVADDGSGGTVPAAYSNFGPWVQACAQGEWVSTYVKGELVLTGAPTEVFDGFARWAGTSFSAPHVTGYIATQMTTYGYTARYAADQLLAAPKWDPNYGVLVG
jgi:hypothetical protein